MKPIYIPIILPLRGIAALSVAIYHMVCTSSLYAQGEVAYKIGLFGKHGVELFFLISGLVIPLSMIGKGYKIENFSRFFLKRAFRIEPPYIVAVALGTIFIFLRESIFKDGALPTPTFVQVISNLLYLVPFNDESWISPVFWTLAIELQFYAFCSLLFAFNIRWNPRILLPVLFLSAVLFPKVFAGYAVFPTFIDCFIVGFLVGIYKLNEINSRQLIAGLAGLCIIMFFTRSLFVSLLLTFAALTIVYLPKIQGSKALQFLGKQSYSLYLTHCLTGVTIVNLSMRYLPELSSNHGVLIIFLALCFAVLMAQLMYLLIEKPFEAKSKGISLVPGPRSSL